MAVPTHNPDPYDLRLDDNWPRDVFGNVMTEEQQSVGGSYYSPAQIEKLDAAVRGPLAPFAGGASTLKQMISGRYGQRAGEVAALFLDNVEAEATAYTFDDTVASFAQRCHDAHRPLQDGDHSSTFASEQSPRQFEEAENRDAEIGVEVGSFNSATGDLAAMETFRSVLAREMNKGRPEGQDLSPQEFDDATEAAWQRQGMGRGDPTPDADPDAEGPGQGLAMDSDGIFRDPVQMADDAAVRDTFSSAFDRAGRMLTTDEVHQQEAAAGLDTRKLDKAHVDYCRKNIEG